jgi:nicotinate-nucleotide adenylyltransferase
MLRCALAREKKTKVWDGEIKNRAVSYTVDTLRAIKKKHPHCQIFFIIGADNLREISGWKDSSRILQLVTLCVFARPGFKTTIPPALKKARIQQVPSVAWGLSSRQLREYLAHGLSCRYCIPDKVLAYIKRYGLYR